jgi:hypothetical protein
MQRAAKERLRTLNIWRRHMREAHGWPKKEITCACDLQANRFRKGQKVHGCGNARCYMCHGEKLLGIVKRKHELFEVEEKEGIKEWLSQ